MMSGKIANHKYADCVEDHVTANANMSLPAVVPLLLAFPVHRTYLLAHIRTLTLLSMSTIIFEYHYAKSHCNIAFHYATVSQYVCTSDSQAVEIRTVSYPACSSFLLLLFVFLSLAKGTLSTLVNVIPRNTLFLEIPDLPFLSYNTPAATLPKSQQTLLPLSRWLPMSIEVLEQVSHPKQRNHHLQFVLFPPCEFRPIPPGRKDQEYLSNTKELHQDTAHSKFSCIATIS